MSTRDVYLGFSSMRCSDTAQPVDDVAFPTSVHLLPHTYRHRQLGLISPTQRLMDELVLEAQTAGTCCDQIPGEQQALVMAAGNCTFAGMQNRKRQSGGFLDYQAKTKYVHTTQILAGRLAQQLGATGHISADTSACASSMKALMDALHLIQHHGFERVAVVATEDQVSLGVLEFFGDMQLCLSRAQLQQGMQPSAFDAHHQGFLIGQGAALIWLETEAALQARGATPRARLLSAVTGGEVCSNPLGQDPAGHGYTHAMQWALRQAPCTPTQIDLIKTHGTGTAMNNRSEAAAIRQVFGEDFVATGYKPRIGHTLGASGLIESLLALADAQQGVIRAIPHRTEHDLRFLSDDRPLNVKRFIALSAGMGNVYGAAIWEVLPP